MDIEQQNKMVDFIIEKNLELGKSLHDVISISLKEMGEGATDTEAHEFHTAVKREAEARLRKETRQERFPKVVSSLMSLQEYWSENAPGLSDEEINKLNQDEYDRQAYLDTTDNINL